MHAHATIANHDARSGQVINKEDTSLYAPRVQAVNDRLSRENGFQVLGADREMSAWEQRRDTFGYDSSTAASGIRWRYARDRSDTVDEFKRNLELEASTLKETVKTDKKTGEVTAGWSYKAVDEWGPKRRSRKRRASNLADDLTKEGVEAYFEEKQRQAEAKRKTCRHLFPQRSSRPNRSRILRQSFIRRVRHGGVRRGADGGRPSEGTRQPQPRERRAVHGRALRAAHGGGAPPRGTAGEAASEVDAARREFHDSKEARDALNHPCPNLLAGAWVFAKAGAMPRTPCPA